jgi:hypothetical protein
MTTELMKNELKMENPSGQEELEALAVTLDIAETIEESQAPELSQEVPESVTDPVDSETTVGLELPPGVTEEPQHVEHMDLTKVQGHRKWVRSYLNVSDDEGELLGDKKLEKEVIRLCDDLSGMDLDLEENPEFWLDKITLLVKSYSAKVSLTENTSIGIVTKYRIREGMLLNAQKVLVKNGLKKGWMEWFKETYGKRLLRSAEDYMRIAEVPNSIRYAVFGKERLLQIIRLIGKLTGDDPIGVFLSKHGIDFDPTVELDVTELKNQTSITLNHQKLVKAGFKQIPKEKVDALVRAGGEIEDKHIKYLKAISQANGDVLVHMDTLIATGGKFDPIAAPDRKAEAFRKTVDRFLDLAGDAIKDSGILSRMDLSLCQQLKARIIELEAKLTPATAAAKTNL